MTIQLATSPYNKETLTKPFIGIVEFDDNGIQQPPKWGRWIGELGQPGQLEIEANFGDILITGQSPRKGYLDHPPRRYWLVERHTRGHALRMLAGMAEAANIFRTKGGL